VGLVELARMDEVAAAAIGFVVANSLHYLLAARGSSAAPSAARQRLCAVPDQCRIGLL
jgi:hypothetical protein